MIKVFYDGNDEWYAGESKRSVAEFIFEEVGGFDDKTVDEIELELEELDDAAMQRYIYDDDEGKELSFAEQLAILVANKDQEFPCQFASRDI